MDNSVDAQNEYDYWFVIPVDAQGNIIQPQSEYIQRFRNYEAALSLVTTDENDPCVLMPGWMWWNIERTCPHCRGNGLEVYTYPDDEIETEPCSFCGKSGRKGKVQS